jgi:hypothetical protein
MAIEDIILSPATKIYKAPVGEALPADTVAYDAAWGGNWTALGYTTTPLALRYETETYEAFVEQVTAAVKEILTKESVIAETTFAELTSEIMALAFNGTASATPAGAGQPAKTELVAGGASALNTYAFGFEGFYQSSAGTKFPLRIFVYKANAVLNGQMELSKNKEMGIPLQIKGKIDTSKAAGQQLIKVVKITAAGSSEKKSARK